MNNRFFNLFIMFTLAVLFAFAGCGGSNDDKTTPASKWSTQLKITASDADDGDEFGNSVAISGDYAIIGAGNQDGSGVNRGAAYIFHKTGTNSWDTGTKITASDAADYDAFGYSVAISGDYAIVGAQFENGSGSYRGAAYIFHRTDTHTWDAGVKIDAGMDVGNNDQFGYSVGISGDYAIVGAPFNEDTGGTDRGAAYIFHRTGTNTWDSGSRIGVGSADNDLFGNSVAISGDYAIVGAYQEDGSGTNRGAAYIIHRTGTNIWSSSTKITASDTASVDYFGNSVAISGDYAIVGAYQEDGSGTDRGAAYIFYRTGTNTWDTGIKIDAGIDVGDNDWFGYSVGISGDYAIVGAWYEDGSGTDRGAAYIFNRTGTNTWNAGSKITASDAQDNDNFGFSVGISGDYAIVGAWYEDGSGANRGAAYIFK
jgi:hypothetical protein